MKKIPIPSYLRKYDNKTIAELWDCNWDDDLAWLRANIPELSNWNDAQIIDLGVDDFGESQERRAFQTPLDSDWFKDYATFLAVFDLEPKHIYIYDCGDGIYGIYYAFANNLSLDRYQELADKRRAEVAERENPKKGPTHDR